MTTRQNIFWGGLLILLFFGALLWARSQDPFFRKWFTLKTTDHSSFKCVALLPKPMRRYPVIIYVHDFSGTLMNDGNDLRQMAELGLAVVSLEYNPTNEAVFKAQFGSLIRYLGRQKWANTNHIAWVGFSLGANWTLDFAIQHPEQQPQLLVQLGGAGLSEGQTNSRLMLLHCPIRLINGEQDKVFPLADTKRMASILRTYGLQVEMQTVPGVPHDMEPERGLVFRNIGEYCLTHLEGNTALQNYHSITEWQTEAPPLWLFWLSVPVWIIGWVAWRWHRKPILSKRIKLKHHEITLRWLAILLALLALVETAIHLVTPLFSVGDTTLFIARKFLIEPKEQADFKYLTAQLIWRDKKLEVLLEHLQLASYNRELINWQLNDKIYRDNVLSPVITGGVSEQFNWRRPLWEEFYPRIRHESSPEDAAQIVVRHLRERVTIAKLPNPSHDASNIWLKQITDQAGFEFIYIAALRSVGVPARLNKQGKAELFVNGKWQLAPRPIFTTSSNSDEK